MDIKTSQLTIIDRSASYSGELTPASSGHGSISEPVSASSDRRSPFRPPPPTRKVTIPLARPPPSPELTNLDCAFPPFPTAKKNNKREEKESRPRTARSSTKSSKHGAGYPPRQRSKSNATDELFSPPSTAASSRQGSISTNSSSRQDSMDQILPRPLPPDHTNQSLESLNAHNTILPLEASVESMSSSDQKQYEPLNQSFDFGLESPLGRQESKTELKETRPPAQINAPESLQDQEAISSPKEPLYKSKRPPPLKSFSDNQLLSPKLKSPAISTPTSAGLLGRSLTRLFGSKKSPSNANRREVVRQALSDEPEVVIANSDELHGDAFERPRTPPKTPALPKSMEMPSYFDQSQSDTTTSTGMSFDSVDSIQEIRDLNPPLVIVDTLTEEPDSTENLISDYGSTPHTIRPAGKVLSIIEEVPSEQDLKHVSIDSVSSYGSIGFSEHTLSSCSSPPTINEHGRKISDFRFNGLTHPEIDEMPAPLKPKMLEVVPDSPTDPLLMHGRLSPLPLSTQTSLDDLYENYTTFKKPPRKEKDIAKGSSSDTTLQPNISKPKMTVPNKGTCRGCCQIILLSERSVSSADGRLTGRYHKRCFVCRNCKETFPTAEFYVHNDHPYCAQHYHELENSLCVTCGKGIEGLYMETANVAGRGQEKHHPECLKCTTCKIQLNHDYFELSGKVYCERDAFRMASHSKTHDRSPVRPSPLVREYISSGEPTVQQGRNFPERRITRLMTTTV